MLNGEGNENGLKINRSNQQKKKNKFARAARFLSFFALFCTTTTLFCRTKTPNFLVTHYFYGGIVVCAYPIFCLLCSCSLLFFTAAHFHLAGRQHFSLSHSRFEFSCFSSYKIRLLFFFNHSLQHFLSNNVEKDTTSLLFFLSKSPGGHAISFQIKP